MTLPIINTDLVLLDVDAGADKEAVIGQLVNRLADAGRTTDSEGLIAAAMAREAQSATGLPGGIAIPHCRSPYVDTASIGFARLQPAVDFGAPDGPADLAFLIAAPESGGAEHEAAVQPRACAGAQGFRGIAAQRVDARRGRRTGRRRGQPGPGGRTGSRRRSPRRNRPKHPKPSSPRRWWRSPPARPVSRIPTWPPIRWSPRPRRPVPRCMWRRRDRRAAPLSAATIAGADAVIFATDVGVKDRQRFAGKPVVASGVKRAINEPAKMVAEALAAADNPNAARVEGVPVRLPRPPRRRATWAGAPGPARSC